MVDSAEFATVVLMNKAEQLIEALEKQTIEDIPQCIDNLRWAIGLLLLPETRRVEYIKDILAKLEEAEQVQKEKPAPKPAPPASDLEILKEATSLGTLHKLTIKKHRGKFRILRYGIMLSQHNTPALTLEAMKRHCRTK